MKILKILALFLITAGTIGLLSGCAKNQLQANKPTMKERALYEEYVEQFDFLSDVLKNKKSTGPFNLGEVKQEISRINEMDKNLRQMLGRKYHVTVARIDQIIFKVIDEKLKEKGWVGQIEKNKN